MVRWFMEKDSAPDPETGDQNTQLYMQCLMSWMVVESKGGIDYHTLKETFKNVCEAAWDQRQGNSCLVGSGTPHMTSSTVRYLLYELLTLREYELFELLVNRLEHQLDDAFVFRCLFWLEKEENMRPREQAMPAHQITRFRAV